MRGEPATTAWLIIFISSIFGSKTQQLHVHSFEYAVYVGKKVRLSPTVQEPQGKEGRSWNHFPIEKNLAYLHDPRVFTAPS